MLLQRDTLSSGNSLPQSQQKMRNLLENFHYLQKIKIFYNKFFKINFSQLVKLTTIAFNLKVETFLLK